MGSLYPGGFLEKRGLMKAKPTLGAISFVQLCLIENEQGGCGRIKAKLTKSTVVNSQRFFLHTVT